MWRQLAITAATDSPDAFRPTLEENLAYTDQMWADLIDSTVRHPRGALWIAEYDDEPVGMVFARVDEDYAVANLGAMWVAPHARRSGLGSALLAAVMQWAAERGAGSVELGVSEGNTAAMRLYQQHGFESTDETQPLREGSQVTVRTMRAELGNHP